MIFNKFTELYNPHHNLGFPGGTRGKEPACQCRRHKRRQYNPWVGSSLGEGNGSPLQYSCLGNRMDRGAWWVTVHGVAKSQTRLSTHGHTHARAHMHTHTII